MFNKVFRRCGAVGFVVGVYLFSNRFLFGVKCEEQIVGAVFFVECGDEVDKAGQQSCGEAFGAFELREGVVVAEEKSKCIDNSQSFHEAIVTIFCYNLPHEIRVLFCKIIVAWVTALLMG